MSYAVVQTHAEPPTPERLKLAFRGVPGLTELDATTFGRDAFGIIVKGFESGPAQTLHSSLTAHGIAAEVVDESILPILPDSFFPTRMDCTEKNLLVYDSLGRVAEVEWQDVLLVAAGSVVLTEFKQVRANLGPAVERGLEMMRDLASPRYSKRRGLFGEVAHYSLQDMPAMDVTTKEERHEHFIVEIILAGIATRYTIKQDRMTPLFFQYLGDRRTSDITRNLRLLVQDIVRHAPGSAINRGTYYLKENEVAAFVYPNKSAFYNELVWLLWRKAQSPPTI